jgi:hypothetical protein
LPFSLVISEHWGSNKFGSCIVTHVDVLGKEWLEGNELVSLSGNVVDASEEDLLGTTSD